jgi:hypothetical protein
MATAQVASSEVIQSLCVWGLDAVDEMPFPTLKARVEHVMPQLTQFLHENTVGQGEERRFILPLVQFASGASQVVFPMCLRPHGTKQWRVQLPLQLAWSVTVHKSQGMRFAQVQCRFSNRTFASGLVYAALSTVYRADDIQMPDLAAKNVHVDPMVLRFHKHNHEVAPAMRATDVWRQWRVLLDGRPSEKSLGDWLQARDGAREEPEWARNTLGFSHSVANSRGVEVTCEGEYVATVYKVQELGIGLAGDKVQL